MATHSQKKIRAVSSLRLPVDPGADDENHDLLQEPEQRPHISPKRRPLNPHLAPVGPSIGVPPPHLHKLPDSLADLPLRHHIVVVVVDRRGTEVKQVVAWLRRPITPGIGRFHGARNTPPGEAGDGEVSHSDEGRTSKTLCPKTQRSPMSPAVATQNRTASAYRTLPTPAARITPRAASSAQTWDDRTPNAGSLPTTRYQTGEPSRMLRRMSSSKE